MISKKKVYKALMVPGEYEILVLAIWYVYSKSHMIDSKLYNRDA